MGLFFLYSASQGDVNVVIKQAVFVGFGLCLMFALSQPDPDIYKILSLIFLIISLLLVVITILFAKEINGAKRWLDLGVFTLQPSELVKIALPLYLASYLFEKPIPIDLKNTFKSIAIIATCFFINC
jgi:rod shape determining protein RodA